MRAHSHSLIAATCMTSKDILRELAQPRVVIAIVLWRERWHELSSKPLCIHNVALGVGIVQCNQGVERCCDERGDVLDARDSL